jgi:hypothetical protein
LLRFSFALAALAVAMSATSLTLSLKQHPVGTSIDGTHVDLFITGPVTMDFRPPDVDVHVDAVIDLGDVQKKFAAIVLARSITRACGDSITLRNAAVHPVKNGTATFAEITSNATIRRVECGADAKPRGTPLLVAGALALRLQANVGANERLAFDITPASGMDAQLAKLLADRALYDALAAMVSGTLSAAAGSGSITAALSPDAAAYEPHVKSASFQELPGGVLGAHLVVALTVPLLKLGDWKIGD